jgi:integrase
MASVMIEKRTGKTGNISYRVKVRVTKKSKILETKNKTFNTEKLANQWAEKTKSILELKYEEISEGIYRKDLEYSEITVGELIEMYLEHPRLSEKIGRTKGYVLNSLLKYDIANITASKLRADDLIKHCEFRLGDDTKPSPQTIYHDITYLKSVIRTAKDIFKVNASTDYHDEAIPTLVELGLIGRPKVRNRRPSKTELAMMEEELLKRQNHRSAKIPYCDILNFSILTAMRIGEITNIKWSDLDRENKTIIIRNRKDPRNKNGNDNEIPLLGGSFDILLKQEERKDPKKPNTIFPYNSRSISAGWQRVRQKLGIEDLRYHDLRREGASRLAEMGLPINIIARVTGHKNLNILQDIYAKIDIKEFGKVGYEKYTKTK